MVVVVVVGVTACLRPSAAASCPGKGAGTRENLTRNRDEGAQPGRGGQDVSQLAALPAQQLRATHVAGRLQLHRLAPSRDSKVLHAQGRKALDHRLRGFHHLSSVNLGTNRPARKLGGPGPHQEHAEHGDVLA